MEADFNRKNSQRTAPCWARKWQNHCDDHDDGTNMNLSGSINVDDEGVPGQKTDLVENGILTSYIHDKISANVTG